MIIPFLLPKPQGYRSHPAWDGATFILDGKKRPVLEFNENFSGWSDDLTTLHEETAGDRHPMDVASRKYAIDQIRLCRVSHPVILEIGCSSGFFIEDMLNTFSHATIIGADVVKEPLYRLAQKHPGVPLIRFDLLQCPLPQQCVDVLIMLNVLEHIEDDDRALQNAFHLIKPGGLLILEVPAGPCLYDAYDAQLKHFRRYSARKLQQKLESIGFTILRKSHLGFILFPAFALVKFINKSFQNEGNVKKQISHTNNRLLEWAMKFELRYLSKSNLPFGIRALFTARRPESDKHVKII